MSFKSLNNSPAYMSKEFYALGTVNQITAYSDNCESALDEAADRVYEINDKMSAFNTDSEVSKINLFSGISAQAVSRDTFYVIDKACYYSEISGGAFSFTRTRQLAIRAVSLQPSRVCKRAQHSNSGQPASVGYLLFPLHEKARFGGLFCLGLSNPHCAARLVAACSRSTDRPLSPRLKP